MPTLTSRTGTTLGTLVLAVGASWALASRWYESQADIARALNRMDVRLTAIEARLNAPPRRPQED